MTVLTHLFRVRTAHAFGTPLNWRQSIQRLSLFSLGVPLRVYAPVAAGTDPFGTLTAQITAIFTSLLTMAHSIAPAVGIIGFLGVGIIYMGSSWPIIGTWKQQNPQMVSNAMLGLFFVMFAGLVVSILPNPGGFS